eukprot:9560460-Alexandrium_andersonii.AAC.1
MWQKLRSPPAAPRLYAWWRFAPAARPGPRPMDNAPSRDRLSVLALSAAALGSCGRATLTRRPAPSCGGGGAS